jgi:hypothetical protein
MIQILMFIVSLDNAEKNTLRPLNSTKAFSFKNANGFLFFASRTLLINHGKFVLPTSSTSLSIPKSLK